jgi:hypothetical protein
MVSVMPMLLSSSSSLQLESSRRRRLPPLPRFLLPHEYTEHQRIHPIYLLVPFVLIVSRLAFVGGDLHGCSLAFDTVARFRTVFCEMCG